MNHKLFINLITNLLKVNVTIIQNESDLQIISKLYQINFGSPSMFHLNSLKYLISQVSSYTFLEFSDELEVNILFFYFNENLFMIGPYIKINPERKRIEEILIQNKLSASFVLSLEHYISNFPILTSPRITETITSIINSFDPDYPNYTFIRIEHHSSKSTQDYSDRISKKSIDYSSIYQRYELENQLMMIIETGDIKSVQKVFKDFTNFSKEKFDKINSTYGLNYYNVHIGYAMIRVLARKAAERSGLSVVIIDEITQRSVQNFKTSSSITSLTTLITELTQAVHDHLIHKVDYSPMISKVSEFLILHYAESYSLTQLANFFNISDSYLSKQFIKETGETINQFMTRLRCQKAAHLLTETDMKITQISEFVGYFDNNYFVKVFKKLYNQTPSEYRNNKISKD